MISLRVLLPLPLVALVSCASAPASPVSAPTPPAAAPAPSAAVEPSAPASPPPPVASAAPAPPPPPAVAPLTQAEQKETERVCKPIMAALQQRKKPGGGTPLEVLEQVLAKPPGGMSPPDVARCADLLRRGIAAYLQAAIEAEARSTTRQLAIMMAAAYEREELGAGNAVVHALCPSAPPVPTDLSAVRGKPYVAKESDWSAPGWTCLRFQLTGNQRFQYEVKTGADGKSFVVLGRAPSADGTRVVEFSQSGKVDEKGAIDLGAPARTERAP